MPLWDFEARCKCYRGMAALRALWCLGHLGEPLSPWLGEASLCPLPSSQGKAHCRGVFAHLSQRTFRTQQPWPRVPGISLPAPVQCSHGTATCGWGWVAAFILLSFMVGGKFRPEHAAEQVEDFTWSLTPPGTTIPLSKPVLESPSTAHLPYHGAPGPMLLRWVINANRKAF